MQIALCNLTCGDLLTPKLSEDVLKSLQILSTAAVLPLLATYFAQNSVNNERMVRITLGIYISRHINDKIKGILLRTDAMSSFLKQLSTES